jgi:hypothetical protein
MSAKLKRFEIFIGLWKYLVLAGTKMPDDHYPKGGIIKSDAEILEEIIDDEDREIQEDKITEDETRYTAFITDYEYRQFLIAIEKDRTESIIEL